MQQSAAAAAMYGEDLELPDLSALRCAMEAVIARLECDLPAVRSLVGAMAAELDSTAVEPSALGRMARAAGGNALAGTLYWHGCVTEATHLLNDIDKETVAHDLPRMRVNAISLKALVLADRGQLRQAQAEALTALELADAVGVASQFQANPARLALAIVALQRGDNAAAATQLAALADRASQLGDRAPHVVATVLLARVSALAGDVKTAFGQLERARTAWPGWVAPPALLAMIDTEEAHLCLLSGDIPSARAISAPPPDTRDPEVDVLRGIAKARLLLAEKRADDSSALFLAAAQNAFADGQLSTSVVARVAAAVARRAAGHLDQAVALLDRALELAHDEDIRAPFLAEADAIRPLLLRMEADHGFRRHEFRENLLTAIGVPPARSGRAGLSRSDSYDVLSRHERAVLRMLSGTLDNRQIASSLDISINTLKTHIRNVHRKLHVENRAQAISRGHELGLL